MKARTSSKSRNLIETRTSRTKKNLMETRMSRTKKASIKTRISGTKKASTKTRMSGKKKAPFGASKCIKEFHAVADVSSNYFGDYQSTASYDPQHMFGDDLVDGPNPPTSQTEKCREASARSCEEKRIV